LAECIDWGFVGTNIKILQLGYMIGATKDFDEYFSIIDV
jgi:hypothetical protein